MKFEEIKKGVEVFHWGSMLTDKNLKTPYAGYVNSATMNAIDGKWYVQFTTGTNAPIENVFLTKREALINKAEALRKDAFDRIELAAALNLAAEAPENLPATSLPSLQVVGRAA